MVRYLLKVIVLMLLFWIAGSAFSLLADFGLKRHSSEPLINEWQQVMKGNINSNLVILGSSRAKKHFNPAIIEAISGMSCFNLGIDGSKSVMQYARWRTYLANNSFPEYVILNVEPGTFGKDSILFNKEQYLPFYGYSPLRKYLKSIVNPLEFYLPVYKYHGYSKLFFEGIVNTVINSTKSYSGNGFSGLPVDINNLSALASDDNYYLSKANIRTGVFYLEQIAFECKQNNCRLLLVYSPQYYTHKNKYSNIEEFDTAIDSFASSNQVSFIDYRNDSLCFQEDLFYDAEHLNKIGADKFSTVFSEQLEAMINDEK